jgi:hypothetical protein
VRAVEIALIEKQSQSESEYFEEKEGGGETLERQNDAITTHFRE